jgi:hypothetical protein
MFRTSLRLARCDKPTAFEARQARLGEPSRVSKHDLRGLAPRARRQGLGQTVPVETSQDVHPPGHEARRAEPGLPSPVQSVRRKF